MQIKKKNPARAEICAQGGGGHPWEGRMVAQNLCEYRDAVGEMYITSAEIAVSL